MNILEKYPNCVPTIVNKKPHSNAPSLDKNKYLVPKDITLGQFVYVLRKRLSLSSDQAIFILVDNKIPPTSQLISDLYEKNKDKDDGYLYIYYTLESVFG